MPRKTSARKRVNRRKVQERAIELYATEKYSYREIAEMLVKEFDHLDSLSYSTVSRYVRQANDRAVVRMDATMDEWRKTQIERLTGIIDAHYAPATGSKPTSNTDPEYTALREQRTEALQQALKQAQTIVSEMAQINLESDPLQALNVVRSLIAELRKESLTPKHVAPDPQAAQTVMKAISELNRLLGLGTDVVKIEGGDKPVRHAHLHAAAPLFEGATIEEIDNTIEQIASQLTRGPKREERQKIVNQIQARDSVPSERPSAK